MMASLSNTKRMTSWLRRLVKDRGAWVDKMSALRDFAKLTHKDGRPTLGFEDLVLDLRCQPWISRGVQREKRCREGHVLYLLGTGAYRLDDGWQCHGLPTKITRLPCKAGINRTGFHLGTRRYHCPTCQEDFCGTCALGSRFLGTVMKVDTKKLHMGPLSVMMRAMKDFVLENEEIVDDLRDVCECILRILERLRSPAEKELVMHVYTWCFLATLALMAVSCLLQSAYSAVLKWGFVALGSSVGSAVLLPGSMPVRRLQTAIRASRGLARCRELRSQGGCIRWHFFTPDLSSHVRSGPTLCGRLLPHCVDCRGIC